MKKVLKIVTLLTLILILCMGSVTPTFAASPDRYTKKYEKQIKRYLKARTKYAKAVDGLNLRKAPVIKKSNIYKTVDYRTKLKVTGKMKNKNWYVVKYKNTEYFVSGKYLTNKKPKLKYLGKYTLTAYCSCRKCCGQWSGGPTASGKMPKADRTVGCNFLPFGTKLKINGKTYVVEDRGGMSSNVIDVYHDSHSTALKFGRKRGVKVYKIL